MFKLTAANRTVALIALPFILTGALVFARVRAGAYTLAYLLAPPQAQRFIIKRLGLLGAAGLPGLGVILKDRDPALRLAAVQDIDESLFLEYVGAEALPLLQHALEDSDERVVAAASGGLLRSWSRAVPYFREQLLGTDGLARVQAANALGVLGVVALPALLDGLDAESSDARRLSAIALKSLGAAAAPACARLCVLLRDPDPEARGAGIAALGSIGPAAQAACDILAELVAADPKTAVRLDAIDALGQIAAPDPAVELALAAVLADHIVLARRAALALAQLNARRPRPGPTATLERAYQAAFARADVELSKTLREGCGAIPP